MYLLDTDHISLLSRGGDAGEAIRRHILRASDGSVKASIVSFEEQTRGWMAEINRVRSVDRQAVIYLRLEEHLAFYAAMPLLSFDELAVSRFQELWVQRIRIGTMDLKIAATALAHNATLLTRNTQDFSRVPNLRLEDWSVASE